MACREPWEEQLKGVAGTEFAVVIAVALLQVLGLFAVRVFGNTAQQAQESWWAKIARRVFGGRAEPEENSASAGGRVRQALLGPAGVDEEDGHHDDGGERGDERGLRNGRGGVHRGRGDGYGGVGPWADDE